MKKRPNIVLVMTDQQRGDALSIEGHPYLMTPNLDALAEGGIRFTSAYSDCPTCIPARHCLMTGQKASTTGVVGFNTKARINTPNTLPNLLRLAGYQTACIGRSMHTYPHHARYGFEINEGNPFKDPYSEFHGLFRNSNKGIFSVWPHLNLHGIPPNGFTSRPWPYEERFHDTNFAIAKSIEFVENRDKEVPFFMYVGTVAPHPPFVPPACYYNRYMGMQLDEPVIGDWAKPAKNFGLGQKVEGIEVHLEGRFNQTAKAGYYGLINHFDDQLHLLLRVLADQKEETYLIFTSDHGEMLGDHNLWRKALPYEGAARVPLIVNGPEIPKGLVIDKPVSLIDILPTCLDIAGLSVPEGVDGESLLAVCAGRERKRGHVRIEHSNLGSPAFHCLTDGKEKYIWFPEDGCEQFFDLHKDPREICELSAVPEYSTKIAEWRKRMIRELDGRPEGFVQNASLVAGRPYPDAMPHAIVDK